MTALIVAAVVVVGVLMECARRRAANAPSRRPPHDRHVDAPGFPPPPRSDDES